MLASFLDKGDCHILDLSAFINYTPEQILFYYYDSWINITLDTYSQMNEWLENGYGNRNNLQRWLDFINDDIGAGEDIVTLRDSEYLNSIGPYYYSPTGTQFHFSRFYTIEHEPLTSLSFARLYNFHKSPVISRDLQKYYHTRKTGKKPVRTREELLRDINVCHEALVHIEELEQGHKYIQSFINNRKAVAEQKELRPPESSLAPQKPSKPKEEDAKFKLLHTMGIARSRQQEINIAQREYNRSMKVYFIKCREFERACERYKDALQKWDENREALISKCKQDIQQANGLLREIASLLSIYHDIIRRTSIHSDYQNRPVLQKFKHYLETGRADDLQGCMNIYEVDQHWIDIKASQERIENTIYFIQSDPDAYNLAKQETERLIASSLDG